MSAHGHDDHGHGGGHDHGKSGHDSHGHDSHGGGHGHGHEHWGDYNLKPPGPSTLPKVGIEALVVFGLALAGMLGAISLFSLKLATSAKAHAVHATESGEGEHEKPEHAPAEKTEHAEGHH